MTTPITHTITVGDTRTPLGATLKQRDATGVLAVVDVTSLTVKFKMVNSNGVSKVALTATGVTKEDAATGQVSYDFQAADVDTAGTYYAWFVIVDGSSETDHFPHDGRMLKVVIKASEP